MVLKTLELKEIWINAYSIRSRGFFFKIYDILFEGQNVLSLTDREEAKQVAAAMNGAYNLGRHQTAIQFQETFRNYLQKQGIVL